MKKGLIGCIAFVVGLGTGAGVGYLFGKKKFEKMADDEIAEMRNHFREKTQDIVSENVVLMRQVTEYNEREKGNSPMEYYNKVNGENYENELLENDEEDVEIDIDEDIPEEFEKVNKKGIHKSDSKDNYKLSNIPPYIIDQDTFGNIEDYEIDALYKTTDGKIIDQENRIVDDYVSLVGSEFYDILDPINCDHLYIRNETRMTDYEVLCIDSSTFDLGITG